MPPGVANPSSRAATFTPSPNMSPSSTTTSPTLSPMRNSTRLSSGTVVLRSAIPACTSVAQRRASTTLPSQPQKVRFAPDSTLEGDGFELLVPRYASPGFSAALRLITLTFGWLPRVDIKPACEWWARLRPVLRFRPPQESRLALVGCRLVRLLRGATACFEPDVFRVRLRFKRP